MADKDGYTEFKLWHFIKELGMVTGPGLPRYTYNNIIVDVRADKVVNED